MNDALILLGICLLIVGGWWLKPALGLMLIGLVLILVGWFRLKGERNEPH